MRVEYDDGGRLMAILWYCIDISDRRAAEQALLDSEERTRAILRTANDAFVGADTGGRIVEWNERAEAIFGWPRESALGRMLADTIVPERYRDSHRQGFARSVQTGNSRAEPAPRADGDAARWIGVPRRAHHLVHWKREPADVQRLHPRHHRTEAQRGRRRASA
jgi:PAS domain S-box-containing protein